MGSPSLLRLSLLALAGVFPSEVRATGPQDDGPDSAGDEAAAFFAEDVFPVLAGECFRCHGGRKRIRGGLTLTSRAGVLAGGDTGPALDLESPRDSRLLAMISYRDEDHEMPPEGKLDAEDIATLTRWVQMGAPWSEAVEIVVDDSSGDDGDEAQEPWGYGPLARPDVPAVRDPTWGRNPIDAFLLAALERRGLEPAPPANKMSLVRRATYDLTGLPPTPAEVDAFLADARPVAYDALIERLLASPHYGEKWARHWLDLVRFAETNGFERDTDKPFIWRYRDYVIEAFNADKPYDQFIREQLAGDELDEVTPETLVATGFTRLMQWDDEPGQGVLQARYDTLDDLVSTTSQVFLGITMGCARCHDHKRDDIPQADYYSFMAFFHGLTDIEVRGPLTEIPTAEERLAYEREVAERDVERARLEARLRGLEADLRARLRELDALPPALTGLEVRVYRGAWDKLPDFDALQPESTSALPEGFFERPSVTLEDAVGFVFEGTLAVPEDGEYRFVLETGGGARLSVAGVTVVDQDAGGRAGALRAGTLALARGTVTVRLDTFEGGDSHGLRVWWSRAEPTSWRYTFEDPGPGWTAPEFDDLAWAAGPGGFGTAETPGAEVGTEWSGAGVWLRREFSWDARDAASFTFVGHHDGELEVWVNGARALHREGFLKRYRELAPDADLAGVLREGANTLAVRCSNRVGGQYVHVTPVRREELGRARPVELAFGRMPLSVEAALGVRRDAREWLEERGAEVWSAGELAEWRDLRDRLQRAKQREIPIPRAFTAREHGADVPVLHVHVRGNAAVPGAEVVPAFPAMLDPPLARVPEPAPGAKSSGRRRVLAEWIASSENPMTARVMANRLWQYHFGRGIVRTPNDFGGLGGGSTNPELLDWLAAEFVERGWSLKAMHRLIMSSSAYRMSTREDPLALEIDPANDLWWRFDLRRLTAEELRDTMIAMTGRLNPKMSGPSFFSRMPADALATSSTPDSVWGTSPVEETMRRSVYIKVKRSLTTPILARFDVADTDSSCAVRFATTQPTQALTMLNGEFVREMAALFADRLRAEAGADPTDQVRLALRLALGREARADEVASHARFIEELRSDTSDGDAVDALADFCLVTLNLNELAYVD